jgi:hypothetical protein
MSLTEDGSANATPSNDPRVTVYRVIDATELAYLRMTGNYGSNPSRSGKYFTLTLAGATAFAAAPMNTGNAITETTLPQSVISGGFTVIDPVRAAQAARCTSRNSNCPWYMPP